jgi:hypothetical protein
MKRSRSLAVFAVHAVLWGLTFFASLSCGAAEVTFSLGSIHHAAFEAEEVSIAFDAAHQGEADIRLGLLKIGDTEYRALRLHCSGFYFDGRRLDCPRGALHRQDARGRDRPALPFSFAWRADDGFLDFSLRDVDAIAFSPLVKRLRGWQPQGKFDLAIAVEGGRARLDLAAHGLEFATREGDLAVKVKGNPPAGEITFRVEQPRGELFYYVKCNGDKNPERVRIRTPTFANIPPLLAMLPGAQLSDVPVLVITIDPCISCTER